MSQNVLQMNSFIWNNIDLKYTSSSFIIQSVIEVYLNYTSNILSLYNSSMLEVYLKQIPIELLLKVTLKSTLSCLEKNSNIF